MPVRHYCQRPARTIGPGEPVRSAAQLMEKENVGSLVVVEEGRPVGMLTDRDVALRVLAEKLDAGAARVRDVMRRPLVTVSAEASLTEAVRSMRASGLRRLPVVTEDGSLLGVLALDDLLRLLASEVGGLAAAVRAQLAAEPALRAAAGAGGPGEGI